MYKINKEDMQVIVNGASFLASGGGGGVSSANDVIDNIVSFAKEVKVVDVNEVSSADALLVVCGVGAPDAPNLNFKNSPAYGLQDLQFITGKKFHYVLPIEVGAMNSMIPLLACAKLGIPFIDADGAGRSVPQMSMCTYALKGFDTKDTLVVSEENDQYPLHPDNAVEMEAQVREVVSTKLQDAGTVATWPMLGANIKSEEALVPGSQKLAHRVGIAMAGTQPLDAVIGTIKDFYKSHRIIMRNAKVTGATNKVEDGFDIGTVTLQDTDHPSVTAKIYFVNESLLATIDNNGQPEEFLMGPDMICCMGINGEAMTNSEICSQYSAGKAVNISLVWIEAREEIRKPSIFFMYQKLLAEKFGTIDYLVNYTFYK